MARVKGPLFSLEASGTIGKTVTYSQWKGRNYVRRHTIPLNPQTAPQVNVRTAMTMLVAKWQELLQANKDAWNAFGKLFNVSGFNSFTKRGMIAYIDQIGSATTPTTLSVAGDPPDEVWTWGSV